MLFQHLLFKYYIMPKNDYDDENVNNLKKDPFDEDDDRDDDRDDDIQEDWDPNDYEKEMDEDDE